MALAKYATLQVLSARIAQPGAPLMRTAHRADFAYTPKPGFLYVRSRAISSRTNDNYDTFPAIEIKKAYRTFVGKPVFVNHHNENHRRARGVIVDAVLHEDVNPDGTPDTWVEVLHEIDAVRFPKLAEALVNGWMDRTSMGTDVKFSVCSFCGNKAATPLEYCQHIPRLKGKRIRRHTASGPQDVLVHEICYGLGFFENSHLVEDPADPTAYAWVESVPPHLAGANQVDSAPRHVVTASDLSLGDLSASSRSRSNPSLDEQFANLSDSVLGEFGGRIATSAGLDTRGLEAAGISVAAAKTATTDEARDWDLSPEERDLIEAVMQSNTAAQATTAANYPHTVHLACGDVVTYHSSRAQAVKVGESWHCDVHGDQPVTEVTGWGSHYPGLGIANLHTALPTQPSPLPAKAKKPKYANPADHPSIQRLGVSSQHVIDHWYKGTPEEHKQGMRWYEDAHHVANALTMGDSDLGGGILSAYSPQANWPVNMFNAMRTFHTGRALQKGEGQVMSMHSKAVDRMLKGEHWSSVLKAPKTYAFAHLISTGGKDPDTGATLDDVVIDRHAMSVAAGRRIVKGGQDEKDMGNVLDNPYYYDHIAQTYRDAAKEISKREGREVSPHQVQAATWLTRQRLNGEEVQASGDQGEINRERGRQKAQQNTYQRWKTDVRSGWPGMLDTNMHDASRHVGYGETKAPPDVDTLRDEQCPICGDQDNFNGDQCAVCGYIAPPAEFQDPDLEKAKQLDLRKDDFEEDPAGPVLQCDTCGAQFPADEAPDDEDKDEDAADPDGDAAVVEEAVVPGGSDPANAAKPDPKVKRKTKVSVTLDRDKDPQKPGLPNAAADPDNAFAQQAQPGAPEDEDEDPEIAPEAGDTCPECGKGTLQLMSPGADEDDPEDDGDDDPLNPDDPDGEETNDSKQDPGAVPFKKKTSAIRAANRRSEVGMANPSQEQRNALMAALASQQRRIESQDEKISTLHRALAALARVAGLERHPVFAALVTADVNNPAQPIPDPPAEGPSETTQQAATPEATDSPESQGAVPANANSGVTPDATTTLDNSNVVLDAQPFNELQDPTRPVAGTEGPRPLSEVKTETDVRVGDPNNSQVAFPLEGPFAARPTTGARSESRLIAAMRLARLRAEAYGEEGDDLTLGQEIADSDLTDEAIAVETNALDRSVAASKTRRPVTDTPTARNLVPRSASAVTRTVPSVAPTEEAMQRTSSSNGLDSALFE